MSSQNYISDTLELPSEIPLFRYNVNSNVLKKLLQQTNIQINANGESIKKMNEQVKTKFLIEDFKAHQKILSNSIKFGLNIQKYIDKEQNKFMQIKIDPKDQKTNSQQFADKVSKLNQIVDYLLFKTAQNEEKINNDDKKHQDLINQSFKRLQNKIQSSVQSFGKTINNYFTQANKKSSGIQTEFNLIKITQDSKLRQMQDNLNNKVSNSSLQGSFQAFKHKILKQMSNQIQSDEMKRMANLEEYGNQLKQLQKNMDLQNKVTKQKVNDLDQKVKNAMATKMFQMQKHKIYEKLSQFKNKTDQLTRKNNEFVEFRKNYLTEKEKMKQQIIGLEDQIKKLNDKQTSFKKMENMSDILSNLDPHLICQIGNQVKLHQKQIGKLQKKIMMLQADSKDNKSGGSQMPQVNAGQNSDLIQKILKEYMSNMDFEGRIKKAQRDVHQISRRTDVFHDLQKKIYNLSKDLDVGAIMKQLKRKCDQQNTKKQLKIVDSKIENLFDYFKTIRKEMQIIYKRTAMNAVKDVDNPSLTSKKLFGANCLSCTPATTKRRTYSRQKLDFSLDEGQDYLKSNTYQKFK